MKKDNLPKPSSVVNLAGQREKDHLVTYSHLLVPVDFSEHSKKTIEYATQLAGFTGGTLHVLHVYQPIECRAGFYRPQRLLRSSEAISVEHELVKNLLETARREANEQLSLITQQMIAQGLKAQPVLRVGNPDEEIVQAAKKTRGRSYCNRFSRLQRHRTLAARQHGGTSRPICLLCGTGREGRARRSAGRASDC